MECSICLETCIQPVQLPCSHIFCFLCVKGVADRYQNCAICRQPIPEDYFDHPVLVPCSETLHCPEFDGGYQWFYEGKNGWWLYDPRTSSDLEEAFKLGQPTCQLLIAGHLYYIDFIRMIQYRSAEPRKRRKIKRDAIQSTVTKGIAGLKSFETLCVNSLSYIDKPSAPPMSPPFSSTTSPPPPVSTLHSPPPPPPPPSPALPTASLSSSASSTSPSNGHKNHRKMFNNSPNSHQSSSSTSRLSPSSYPISPHRPPSPPSLVELLSRLSFELGNDANLLG